MEKDNLEVILEQVRLASETASGIVVLGDFNLDSQRSRDESYSRRLLLNRLVEGMKNAGLNYAATPPTWRSYGRFAGVHRVSWIDHIYYSGVEANVKVLEEAITDHQDVLAQIKCNKKKVAKSIVKRNYKKIRQSDLEAALSLWP
ncbi:Hypothetical protein FKW44_023814 [Caligus rogercresseyi]|uniref:Endonuclease/exonuclease/phosphatase domain-containing protein n=1 Tax=Caligus rogercresseyi TaxID=217165 RepID=A0A7T8GQA3_CALRO|nr:Hypothetical protein FKW44_023814 [Caligus rogercresseyi]